MRRSPIWTARAYLRNSAETGRLRADHGRQDKSAAFGRAHVVGWIGDFRHLADPTCWRFLPETPTISMCQAPSPGSARALPAMTIAGR